MFADRIASPDYSDLSLEARLQREAAATTFLIAQRIARSTATAAATASATAAEQTTHEHAEAPAEAITKVRVINMELPANGTPAYARQQARP